MKEKKKKKYSLKWGEGYYEGVVVASWIYFFLVILLALVGGLGGGIEWIEIGLTYGFLILTMFVVAIFFMIYPRFNRKKWKEKEEENEL